jgi:isopenicillin N synthase-like dioxygenase
MASSNESTTSIPVVDFGAFLNGSEEDKKLVARQLDDAFRDVGFVYLRNHGVRKEVVEECFEWVRATPRHFSPYPLTVDKSVLTKIG